MSQHYFDDAARQEIEFVRDRTKAVAIAARQRGASKDLTKRILDDNFALGERRYNSNGTGIKHGGLSRPAVGASIHESTCRVRDHKARKRVRVEHTCSRFAHTVDLHRLYVGKSAPFRKGGYLYERASHVGKRRMRDAVRMADHISSKGEITAALEFLLGSR